MQTIYIALVCALTLVSCNTKMNQYINNENNVNKRDGKWKEEYSADEGILTAFGKYKKGEKVGIWKIYLNNKLYEKNKFKKIVTKTKKYFPNGELMERGKSKVKVSQNERHWFYFGDWKYYDQKGNLLYIKKYAEGKKMDSISFIK